MTISTSNEAKKWNCPAPRKENSDALMELNAYEAYYLVNELPKHDIKAYYQFSHNDNGKSSSLRLSGTKEAIISTSKIIMNLKQALDEPKRLTITFSSNEKEHNDFSEFLYEFYASLDSVVLLTYESSYYLIGSKRKLQKSLSACKNLEFAQERLPKNAALYLDSNIELKNSICKKYNVFVRRQSDKHVEVWGSVENRKNFFDYFACRELVDAPKEVKQMTKVYRNYIDDFLKDRLGKQGYMKTYIHDTKYCIYGTSEAVKIGVELLHNELNRLYYDVGTVTVRFRVNEKEISRFKQLENSCVTKTANDTATWIELDLKSKEVVISGIYEFANADQCRNSLFNALGRTTTNSHTDIRKIDVVPSTCRGLTNPSRENRQNLLNSCKWVPGP